MMLGELLIVCAGEVAVLMLRFRISDDESELLLVVCGTSKADPSFEVSIFEGAIIE